MTLVSAQAKAFLDNTGTSIDMPVLLSEAGPLLPLIDYLSSRAHDRSPAWMRKVVQAVGLLLAYVEVNSGVFEDSSALFTAFVQRLHRGTIGPDGDPTGLHWQPRRAASVNALLTAIRGFSDWLVDTRGGTPLVPSVLPSGHDERLMLAAWEHRQSNAFLGHTLLNSPIKARRSSARAGQAAAFTDDAIAFPEKSFMDLLLRGFVRHGHAWQPDPLMRLNLRDILITLLMHGAGLRMSECFHLWVHDVQPDPLDPSLALVRIHHPSEGDAPPDWLDGQGRPVKCNRAAYLAGRYGLRPRHEVLGSQAAGWKNPALDGRHFIQAYWFPSELGRLFLRLWNLYLHQLVQIPRHHPYAFIGLKGRAAGDVYCIKAFQQAHQRAVERIGLESSKAQGTSPHGHRRSLTCPVVTT